VTPDISAEADEVNDSADKTKTDGKKHHATIKQLEEQVAALQAAQAQQTEKFLRLAAEYENFRKRSAKEKESIYNDSIAEIVKTFLPLMDSLLNADKFTAAAEGGEAYAEGVRLILAQLRDCFERLKVGQTGEVGEEFDPNAHFAIMHEQSDDPELQNKITEVFQHGYQVAGKIIRPAMVKVVN